MQIKSFNTGRPYTKEGQLISYTITESGFLLFWDHSRHVEGAFQWDKPGIYSDAETERALVAQYDCDGFWNETCYCMQAIGRADYYRIRDTLRGIV